MIKIFYYKETYVKNDTYDSMYFITLDDKVLFLNNSYYHFSLLNLMQHIEHDLNFELKPLEDEPKFSYSEQPMFHELISFQNILDFKNNFKHQLAEYLI